PSRPPRRASELRCAPPSPRPPSSGTVRWAPPPPEDAKAYGAVSQAYALPKETDAQRRARTEQIQRALVVATEVPLGTAMVAADVIQLTRRIVDRANVNVLADLAAATASARAALEAALISG